MRILQSFIVRALCAAAVGYLLVIYRTEMVQWLTIAIGALFLVSGVLSVVVYYSERHKAQKTAERLRAMAELRDGKDAPDDPDDILRAVMPSFPLVGLGSIILGFILALMPATFVTGVLYVLAAMLILGGINQLYNLFSVRRLAKVSVFFWLLPCVVLLAGIYMVVRPMEAAAMPFRILGWGLMLYAVAELINGIQIYRIRKRVTEAEPMGQIEHVEEIEEAEIVEEQPALEEQ